MKQSSRITATSMLNRYIDGLEIKTKALPVFERWKNLREMTRKFCWFVTPYIDLNGVNVGSKAILKAFEGYYAANPDEPREQARAYIQGIVSSVDDLCHLRLSVKTTDEQWAIWQYEQPLSDWMRLYDRESVMIMQREKPIDHGPIAVKLLAYISSTKDLELYSPSIEQIRKAS